MSTVIHPVTVPGTTRVTASITETRHDPMATAYFVNATRASAYAQQLLDSGNYPFVQIQDTDGKMWVLTLRSSPGPSRASRSSDWTTDQPRARPRLT